MRMAGPVPDDQTQAAATRFAAQVARLQDVEMTAFIESCVETAADSAVAVERGHRHRPRAQRLLRVIKNKKNILVTTHEHPDPDALASSFALCYLLRKRLRDAKISFSIKGTIGRGYNSAFMDESELKLTPWSDEALAEYDAIILLDVQPLFEFNPLPEGLLPTAVIDHHRSHGRRPKCPYVDIRTDVGASSSIVFSYFMDLDIEIPRCLAATLLFGIETDLAGAAGQPGELDNMALSSLTLLADTRKLYKMRYAALPQSIYLSYADGLANAVHYEGAMVSHLQCIESPEAPAVIADFLLRYEEVQWVLVTAVAGKNLALSMRTNSKGSAADIMRRLVRRLGTGGGHRTKAGGSIPMQTGSAAEIDRLRSTLRARLLRALRIPPAAKPQRLVPKREC